MMTKEQMHEAIDRLTEKQLNKVEAVLEELEREDPRERWKGILGTACTGGMAAGLWGIRGGASGRGASN